MNSFATFINLPFFINSFIAINLKIVPLKKAAQVKTIYLQIIPKFLWLIRLYFLFSFYFQGLYSRDSVSNIVLYYWRFTIR